MSLPTRPSFRTTRDKPIKSLGILDLPARHLMNGGRILIDGGEHPTASLLLSVDVNACPDISDSVREVISSPEPFECLSPAAKKTIADVLAEHIPQASGIAIEDKFFTVEFLLGIPLPGGPETMLSEIERASRAMEKTLADLINPWSVDDEPFLYTEIARRLSYAPLGGASEARRPVPPPSPYGVA